MPDMCFIGHERYGYAQYVHTITLPPSPKSKKILIIIRRTFGQNVMTRDELLPDQLGSEQIL